MSPAFTILGRRVEVGVTGEQFSRVGQLVGDSLSRPVIARKEFQVLDPVVVPVAVDVVNSFVGKKLSSNILFHHVAMLKDFVHRNTVGRGKAKHDVISFDAARDLRRSVFGSINFAGPFVFALPAAKALCSVERAIAFSSASVEQRAAVLARSSVPFVRVLAPTDVRARHGAVQRVFAMLLAVRRKVARLHGERFAAGFAGKFHGRNLSSWAPVLNFVISPAHYAAVSARSVLGFDPKRCSAMFTNLIDRHVCNSLYQGVVARSVV